MTVLRSGAMSVTDYRCAATPADRPFDELHERCSLSFVRKGSFGYRSRGRSFELVAGSILVGRAGDTYRCTHDHHAGGDECLSFGFAPALIDAVGGSRDIWHIGHVPPLAELMVLGELAQAAAEQRNDIALDEAGTLLLLRFLEVVSGRKERAPAAGMRARRRAVETALWIEAQSDQPLALDDMAAQARLSPFHFLRLFTGVLGLTPHQYLIRCRLRHAARLLADRERPVTEIALDVGFADLSNFIRSFRRAAGVSPRGFRRLAKGDRRLLKARLAPCWLSSSRA